MSEPRFFPPPAALTLVEIAHLTKTQAPRNSDPQRLFRGAAALQEAMPDQLSFFALPQDIAHLHSTEAGACLIAPRFSQNLPETTLALLTSNPGKAFSLCLDRFYPLALQQSSSFATLGVSPGASIHPEARLESNVIVDPGAVIGPRAEIGEGSLIGANSVIGPEVRIGRNCRIGPLSFVSHALIGNRVTLHPGSAIGQDAFGFSVSDRIPMKTPHTGRVILQDQVEIGANSTIDRGMARDTVIGEGTKIDSLVRIAPDVRLGRFCLIYAQSFIAEGVAFGDFAVLGGQAGVAPQIEIPAGTKIAPQSGVYTTDKNAARLAGTPAQPLWQWLRETGFLRLDRHKPGRNQRAEGSKDD